LYVSSHVATLADIFGPDQPSDRAREQTGDKGGEKGGDKTADKSDVTDWLDKQREKAPVAPALPAERTVATPPRQMIVIMGSTMKQVEFPSDGAPPTNQPDNEPASIPTPSSVIPAEPPLTPPPIDTPAPPGAEIPPSAPTEPPTQTEPPANGN
jgi:hypothetical protein